MTMSIKVKKQEIRRKKLGKKYYVVKQTRWRGGGVDEL